MTDREMVRVLASCPTPGGSRRKPFPQVTVHWRRSLVLPNLPSHGRDRGSKSPHLHGKTSQARPQIPAVGTRCRSAQELKGSTRAANRRPWRAMT
jgi:hypothetical protein